MYLYFYQCLCISGVGVAQETNTACGMSEEASMLFTEGIALNDVENMRVSSAPYGISFLLAKPKLSIPLKQISRNQVIKLSLIAAADIAASSEDASAESVGKRTDYRRNCYGHCLVNLRDGGRR